jgi:hypothetical protein
VLIYLKLCKATSLTVGRTCLFIEGGMSSPITEDLNWNKPIEQLPKAHLILNIPVILFVTVVKSNPHKA